MDWDSFFVSYPIDFNLFTKKSGVPVEYQYGKNLFENKALNKPPGLYTTSSLSLK